MREGFERIISRPGGTLMRINQSPDKNGALQAGTLFSPNSSPPRTVAPAALSAPCICRLRAHELGGSEVA